MRFLFALALVLAATFAQDADIAHLADSQGVCVVPALYETETGRVEFDF